MYRIGIDLGGTNIVAGLVDENYHIVDKCSIKTNVPRPIEDLVADMFQLVEQLLSSNDLHLSNISSIGVGVPGTANQSNGHIEDANNLGYDNTPFLSLLSESLPVPVYFENDANVAAWGEYLAGEYVDDSFLMVTIGTGIGGGIILNGRLWPGINGAAAEFGHMTIRYDGIECNCGRRGCFEALASANALIQQAKDRMMACRDSLLWRHCGGDISNMEAKTVFECAAAGDKLATILLDRYLTYLAEGITNLINIFQPAVVCIGGGVSKAGNQLLIPLRGKVSKLIYSKNSEKNSRIELAVLDNDAGVLGAALLGTQI